MYEGYSMTGRLPQYLIYFAGMVGLDLNDPEVIRLLSTDPNDPEWLDNMTKLRQMGEERNGE